MENFGEIIHRIISYNTFNMGMRCNVVTHSFIYIFVEYVYSIIYSLICLFSFLIIW